MDFHFEFALAKSDHFVLHLMVALPFYGYPSLNKPDL